MVIDLILFFLGLTILYFGAEYLVRGSANAAVILGADPIVVGLTVVAIGTSMPELVASLIAALKGSHDIALGNVVGSNIANIGLVLAIGAIIYPIVIQRLTFNRDVPVMLGFTFLFIGMAYTGTITRQLGISLIVAVVLYTGYLLYDAMNNKEEAALVADEMDELIEKGTPLSVELAITAGGIIGVMIGAYLLVESATSIARSLGVSELVIGVTVVAVGTSLPELATTAVAAFRKHADIAVGNIIGSNIYNIGLIMGVTATVTPIPVAESTVAGEMLVMTLFSVAMVPLLYRLNMGRTAGIALLAGYAIFIWWSAAYKSMAV
jgi:cation:H+ antiporter